MTRKPLVAVTIISTFCLLILPLSGLALVTNWTIGGAGGYGKVHETISGVGVSKNNSGFAWNIHGGYTFNRFIAAEIGYVDLPKETFGSVAKSDQNYYPYIAAKGMLTLPVVGIGVFGKLGYALVHHRIRGMVTPSGTYSRSALFVAVGASYRVLPLLWVDVQVATTSKNSPVPAMTAYTTGLSLSF